MDGFGRLKARPFGARGPSPSNGLSLDLLHYNEKAGKRNAFAPSTTVQELVRTVRSNVTIDWTLRCGRNCGCSSSGSCASTATRRTSRRRRRRRCWNRRRCCPQNGRWRERIDRPSTHSGILQWYLLYTYLANSTETCSTGLCIVCISLSGFPSCVHQAVRTHKF